MSFDSHGHPQVNWPGRTASSTTQATLATSLVALAPEHLGKTIALSFPSGSVQPLILGVVWQPSVPEVTKYQSIQAELDGEIVSLQDHDQHVHKNNLHHLELEGQESVTLRCGKASITLTADGQILLRAAYISSHSSGTQRIKGAAVRIN